MATAEAETLGCLRRDRATYKEVQQLNRDGRQASFSRSYRAIALVPCNQNPRRKDAFVPYLRCCDRCRARNPPRLLPVPRCPLPR